MDERPVIFITVVEFIMGDVTVVAFITCMVYSCTMGASALEHDKVSVASSSGHTACKGVIEYSFNAFDLAEVTDSSVGVHGSGWFGDVRADLAMDLWHVLDSVVDSEMLISNLLQ